jgi:type IV fimbrial biogenesis protein FimT
MNANKQYGFTLIELVVTLLVAAVLVLAGVPALQDYVMNSRLTSQTNALVGTLNMARSEAITQNAEVMLTALDAGDTANEWGKGWRMWVDGNTVCGDATAVRDGTYDRDCESLREIDSATSRIAINGPDNLADLSTAATTEANTLSFSGNGMARINVASMDFILCDDRTGELGRHIRLMRAGRVVLLDREYQCD